jgi:hypothetical protein
MKKNDLRKVKFTKNIDGSGPKNLNGFFHSWGDYYHYDENSAMIPIIKAIIEREDDGTVLYIDGWRMKFVDEF